MTQSKRYEIAPKRLTFVQQHYTIMDGKDDISNVIREKKAARVTWVGFFTNLILSAAKIIAGIWGRSSAMIADGIHSLSDFITDFIVIIFIKISSKNEDSDHPYGHSSSPLEYFIREASKYTKSSTGKLSNGPPIWHSLWQLFPSS